MKHIVIIAAAVLLMFLIIAWNLSDYNNLSQQSKEKKISESIKQAQLDKEAANTQQNKWDKVHNAQEKNKETADPESDSEVPLFIELRDENNEIYGYQQIENIVYDEEGNLESFDKVGEPLTPEEYQAFAEEYRNREETTASTKRPIPTMPKSTLSSDFAIIVE